LSPQEPFFLSVLKPKLAIVYGIEEEDELPMTMPFR
jgi:hypothetical protein